MTIDDSQEKDSQKPYTLNPPQQELFGRLCRLVGPVGAEFYRDACRIMETNPSYASTTHLVSHLLREIDSSIRAILDGISEGEQEKSEGELEEKKESHAEQIIRILKISF